MAERGGRVRGGLTSKRACIARRFQGGGRKNGTEVPHTVTPSSPGAVHELSQVGAAIRGNFVHAPRE